MKSNTTTIRYELKSNPWVGFVNSLGILVGTIFTVYSVLLHGPSNIFSFQLDRLENFFFLLGMSAGLLNLRSWFRYLSGLLGLRSSRTIYLMAAFLIFILFIIDSYDFYEFVFELEILGDLYNFSFFFITLFSGVLQ